MDIEVLKMAVDGIDCFASIKYDVGGETSVTCPVFHRGQINDQDTGNSRYPRRPSVELMTPKRTIKSDTYASSLHQNIA